LVTRIIITCMGCLLLYYAKAQNCFVTVTLNTNHIYIQQPFRVTVTVYTSTWYTAPLDFDNLQIPNAFILPFSRTQPGIYQIDGKQYAGLQFYFIVFPYKAGTFHIPSFSIRAETPPDGDYRSRNVTLTTKPQAFTVADVPASMRSGNNWLVAKNVFVSEHWDHSLQHVKVGDVIKQTIYIDARGTLPQFIPAPDIQKPSWASIYPDQPTLKDTRDDNDANGVLTTTVTYLLEKQGTFNIDPITVEWWNPYSRHINKKRTAAYTLHVNENPNLGILATMKDSLAAKAPSTATARQPYLIAGVRWYWFIAYILAAMIVLYVLIKLVMSIIKRSVKAYRQYVTSEAYYYKRFYRSRTNNEETMQYLYTWWDSIRALRQKSPAIIDALQADDKPSTEKEMEELLLMLYGPPEERPARIGTKQLKKDMQQYRKQLVKKASANMIIPQRQLPWNG